MSMYENTQMYCASSWIHAGVLLLLGLSCVTDVLGAPSLLYASAACSEAVRAARGERRWRQLQHAGSVLALILAA